METIISGMKVSKRAKLVIAGLCIAFTAFLFRNGNLQGINWTFPYFSGAANFESFSDWRISPDEYDKVAALSDKEHRAYRYVATEVTIQNTTNSYGYVLVALIARNLFPWLGDVQGVIILQSLLHIGLSLFILSYLILSPLQRWLFFFFYAVNPLVLRFVTFPYYYWWTVVPSFLLVIAWIKPDWVRRWLPVIIFVLLFCLLIRPVTLFVALLVFVALFLRSRNKKMRHVIVYNFIFFGVGLGFLFQQGPKLSPIHTMYVGIGAYSNPYGINTLSDSEGFKFYQKVTGEMISTHAINGNWGNATTQKKYVYTLSRRYLQILKESPELLVRNAFLNTIQAFAVGYDVDRSWSRPVTVMAGLLVLILLIVSKQWIWLVGIFAYAAAFTCYYPPIPAYLFGAYLLSAMGISSAVEHITSWWQHRMGSKQCQSLE